MENTVTRPTHGGTPTYFRALCLTASQGGAHSYKEVGYSFGMATESEIPFDADYDEWNIMLEEIRGYIENEDHKRIWQWYQGVYPQAMKLIPNGRKGTFIGGILEAYNDGKLWFI